MPEDPLLKSLDEALRRRAKLSFRERMDDLVRRGILNEKYEVIVRMPIGPGPNAKRKRKRKKPGGSSSAE
jgi:hypothetical protein